MITFVVRNALIVDGTGADPFLGEVRVVNDRIAEVRAGTGLAAATSYDAAGRVLCPGFIDLHTHSDLTRFAYPLGETRILQGVTTEVIGNCGLSPAPVGDDASAFRASIGPIDVSPSVPLAWTSASEYLDAVEAVAASSNIAPLIGHGSLRQKVMGQRLDPPDEAGLTQLCDLLEEALTAGYWGVSLGLMYSPGEYAQFDELLAIARTVAAHRGLLAVHMRAYDAEGLPRAVAEVIELAQRSGAATQISHLRSVADAQGEGLDAALALLASTEADVTADAYPYLAGHTTILQLFPPALRAAGPAAILEAIGEDRARVVAEFRALVPFGPDAITVVRAGTGDAAEVGKTLAELADGAGMDWVEMVADLVVRYEASIDVIVVGTREIDADRVLRLPYVSVASDGVALSLGHDANLPHPRSAGTFPRAFRQLADGGMALSEIVRKMTSQPAQRIGLHDRGIVKAGAVADLVLCDPGLVRDTASYAAPLSAPAGIDCVWVAGQQVVSNGAVTGRTPGVLLRSNR